MKPKHEYYETLGIKRGAAEDEIRKAYRRLARKHHPDVNPGDKAAEDRFKNVQEAYDVLSDAKKRQMYDQFGFYSETGFPGAGGPQGPGAGFGFDGFDFTDIFTGAAGGARGGMKPEDFGQQGGGSKFSDLFSQFLGGNRRAQRQPEKGADLEYTLSIDFWRSMKGTQVKLNIARQEQCATCHGSGQSGGGNILCPGCNGSGTVSQQAGAMRFNLSCPRCEGTGRLRNVCHTCHGDGRVTSQETVDVRIPAGVHSGDRLRVAGKGNAGTMGAAAGDLYITLRVDPHPFFEREGDDIKIQIPVTVWEAALGTKIEVPTIDGRALLKIPQGTQNGQRFRLRERGVNNARKDKRGDQIIEVVVQAPKAQDERTREILRELAQLHDEDPRAEMWAKI
ncbi:MAG: molecular chaperone DnaJ [Bryobacterales bacterium]|nr:molecular chaperone DnaJ [Bryobacterales bacterium]